MTESQPLQYPATTFVKGSAGADTLRQPMQTQPLTDEEREDHIRDCTRLMEAAYERYEDSSNLADRGEADHWRILRDEAVKGRSAGMVAKLERERGLA